MAQTKHQIQQLLADAGSHGPRHRFGQNFMVDQNLVRLVADAGELSPEVLAIEVGPGTGTLTDELLARAGRVLAVEIDRDLSAMLRNRFAADNRFSLIEGDALAGKHDLNPQLADEIAQVRGRSQPVHLVANLPYNIASPLLIELLLAGVQTLAFTVQKEVAHRMRATGGDEAYGPLSVMAGLLADVEILRTLPPQAFWPAPGVDSALVRMHRRDRLGDSARAFSRFVQQLFGSRRKTLRNAIERTGHSPDLLAAVGIDPTSRVDVVPPEKILELFIRLQRGTRTGDPNP